ncbi:MAG: radical SAM protein [Planctomycetota bacterium]
MNELFQELIYDQTLLSPRCAEKALWLRRAFEQAVRRRREVEEAHEISVPAVVVLSVTTRCNLNCVYCYAATHPQTGDMPEELLDSILAQGQELGCFSFLLTGGEPFLHPRLLPIARRHPQILFLVFTNGTLMTPALAAELARLGNVIVLISLDGDKLHTDANRGAGVHDRVRHAFRDLRRAEALFGFSATVTASNVAIVESPGFLEELRSDGCRLGFYFEYIPVGRSPVLSFALAPARRSTFRQRVRDLRNRQQMFLVEFPGDEELQGGCLAAGRGLIHINAQGFVEPCPAIHLAADSVATKPLLDCLRSPVMTLLRERSRLRLDSPCKGVTPQESHACRLLGKEELLAQARLHSWSTG